MLSAPIHLLEVFPKAKTGVPTFGVVVTLCMDKIGPKHPLAVAVTVEFPVHVLVNVTVPVNELIVFPAAKLVASNE